jgi:hypothetical protein
MAQELPTGKVIERVTGQADARQSQSKDPNKSGEWAGELVYGPDSIDHCQQNE